IPIRKVSSAEGKVKEECKRRSPRLSVKRAPTKTNAKPRKMVLISIPSTTKRKKIVYRVKCLCTDSQYSQ
uniref:Uncharacterized protein n=1 Tax=Sciurus vulgaris TaxID=55149 RepID=A0A8D2D4D1_SCIVU